MTNLLWGGLRQASAKAPTQRGRTTSLESATTTESEKSEASGAVKGLNNPATGPTVAWLQTINNELKQTEHS